MQSKHLALIVIFFITILVGYSYFEQKNGSPQTANKKDIETIVHDYIMENPKVLISSVEKMHDSQNKEADAKRVDLIKEKKQELTENKNDPKAGNLKGKHYVVEFFDYACGYCKKMLPAKEQLLSENKDVFIVFKELPVLGQFSENVAKVSLAVHKNSPMKYMQFHSEMLRYNGPRTNEGIASILKKIDVTNVTVEDAIKDKELEEIILANRLLAQSIGVMGTPAYIVDDKFFPGALDYAELSAALK